jgi:O-antigen/teichoic acid export membrane protein
MVLATAIFNGATQLAIRGRTYGAIGVRGLTNAIVTTIAQVGLGVAGMAVPGLILGFLLGRLVSTFTMLRQLGRHLLPIASLPSSARNYRVHWRYPLLYAPSSLLNLVGTYAPIVIVIHAYGASAAGQLGMAQTLVLAPLGLLGTAAGQVFIGELTASLRSGSREAGRHYLRASRLLAIVAVPVLLVLLVLGPTLIPLVLGDRWTLAGELGAAIGISACAGLVASPLSYVFVAYGKNLLSFVLDASRVLLVVGIGMWTTSSGGASVQEAVLAMSLGQAANYLLTWMLGARAASSRGEQGGGMR